MQKLTFMNVKNAYTVCLCVCVHTDICINGRQLSMDILHFVHLVSAFVLDYQGCLFNKQPWKVEIVSPSGTEGRGQIFFYCQNKKHNASLKSKGWAGSLAALFKRLWFPKVRAPHAFKYYLLLPL